MPHGKLAYLPGIGMPCPKCDANNTSVKDSRAPKRGIVQRRRLCTSCGHKFLTSETAGDMTVFERERLMRKAVQTMANLNRMLNPLIAPPQAQEEP